MLTLSQVESATRQQCVDVLTHEEFVVMMHHIDWASKTVEELRELTQRVLEQRIRNRKCAEMRVWFVDEFAAYRYSCTDSQGQSLAEDWLLSGTIRNAIKEACYACEIPIDEAYFDVHVDGMEATWVCDLEGI